MSLETEFRLAAQQIVAEFSGGVHTLRKMNSSYNATTGVVAESYTDTTAPMVQDSIDEREVNDASYTKDHFKVIMAGLDIDPVEPEISDRIITPNSTTHEIVSIKTDQYRAAYVVHVKKGA